MKLLAKLQEDLKDAMRARDVTTKETLRMTIAALKNRRIETGEDLDEGTELQVLTKQVKSREDSVEQYEAADRKDLADKERAEIEVLRRYLPEQLSEDAVRTLVERVIADQGLTSKKEMGQVMKAIMAEHRGKVDGKLVQKLASESLA
jgi:uncharacterized protein YqeY